MCNTGFGIRIPGFKTGWMLLGVSFHRVCRPAVGVAFPQHRVDGTAQDFGITGFYRMLFLRLRIFRIVRKGVALVLKFADGILELGHGSTDVWEFDDVCFRRLGQFPEFRQVIRNLLFRFQFFRKGRKDPACKGDISGFQFNPGNPGEGLDDR